MFDVHLLSASHFIFLLVSFTATFVWVLHRPAKFAGVIPASIAVILSLFILEDLNLKVGLVIALALIIAVGRTDDVRRLSAASQLFWQLVISIILVVFGWTIPYVTNPFGPGVLELGIVSLPVTVAWIILMMNAINWLDGVDGLASVVAIVAFVTLAGVSLLPATQDATTLGLALIGAGALTGFFLHNAPPARVYLGTVGSWFVGIFLALTAIIGGGKVATATLVLALPVLDVFFVVVARLLARKPPWIGDKKHLHYRLSALGWKAQHIILAAAALSASLGIIAVTAQTQQKIWALGGVALLLLLTILSLSYTTYAHRKTSHR